MNVLALEPGLYTNVPDEDYHQRSEGVASKSILDLVDRSPAHYKAWLDGYERPTTPALAFGKAVHAALLEPERFLREYVAEPDYGDCRFKGPKAERERWRAANAGRKRLSQQDAQAIRDMYAKLMEHPIASNMVRDGAAEVTLRWKDEATGLQCKARADYYVEGLRACFDLKTTEDASPEAFARSVAKWRYHVQNAFYAEGFRAIGKPLDHFVFIAVEKAPPYSVALYSLRDADVELGERTMRRNMQTLLEGVQTKVYPAYSTEIETIELPGWAVAQEDWKNGKR